MEYNRYRNMYKNGVIKIVPFVKIEESDFDYFETYHRIRNRLDLISYKYYNNSGFAWLIMQANPQYGSLEQEIPEGTILRIPYPLERALEIYDNGLKK